MGVIVIMFAYVASGCYFVVIEGFWTSKISSKISDCSSDVNSHGFSTWRFGITKKCPAIFLGLLKINAAVFLSIIILSSILQKGHDSYLFVVRLL